MYPELVALFSKRGRNVYSANFRLREPENEIEKTWETGLLQIDDELFIDDAVLSDVEKYGQRLGQAIFADPQARDAWKAAETAANAVEEHAFRFRLGTDQASIALQGLRWELLRLPGREGDKVFASDRVFFSRHWFSSDSRPVKLRAQTELSAFIAIASPPSLSDPASGLAPLNLATERETAEHGLARLKTKTCLISDEQKTPPAGKLATRVTLAAILEQLRKDPPDVLYLACHGALDGGEPLLVLETESGDEEVVSGDDLVEALRGLRVLPRLAILLSCQSAGTGKPVTIETARQAAIAGLGPKLAEAGIASVIAMQGDFSHETAKLFFAEFFEHLSESGQVDEAMARARFAVQDRPDFWMPVLYTRLLEGRLWFVRCLRTTNNTDAEIAWNQLCIDIKQKKCVPILGSGLLEPLMGSTMEIARDLALERGVQVSRTGREDLPQVSQYLQTLGGDTRISFAILETMRRSLVRRFPALAAQKHNKFSPGESLRDCLVKAWEIYRADHPFEVHRYLAEHGSFQTFITMNGDNLMETALRAECLRADPTIKEADLPIRSHYLRWSESIEPITPEGPGKANYNVFHLSGRLESPDSLITTEDNYFEFLTTAARMSAGKATADSDEDQAVHSMLGSVARSALMFLGFRHSDWDFRTLCKLLTRQPPLVKKRVHIAVQVVPEEGTREDAAKTRDYISRLFDAWVGRPLDASVGIYWGSTEDFLQELDKHWKSA